MSTATTTPLSLEDCPMCGYRRPAAKACARCGEPPSIALPSQPKTTKAADAPLFTPMQAAAAAFLGGWAAGGFVLAMNYLRLKRAAAAIATAIVSLAVTAIWALSAVKLPVVQKTPAILLWSVMLLGTLGLGKLLQGQLIEEEINAGREQAKGGAAIGIIIAAVAIGTLTGLAVLFALV